MAQSNDIVINAKANTKDAEKNIKRLDAEVKTLASRTPAVDRLNRSLSKTKVPAGGGGFGGFMQNNQTTGAGFSAMNGGLSGLATKLGALGLAIGAVIKAYERAEQATRDYISAMDSAAQSRLDRTEAVKKSAEEELAALSKFDELARQGKLTSQEMQQEQALVDSLARKYTNLGISIDKTTGAVIGLATAQQKINQTAAVDQLTPLRQQLAAANADLKDKQNKLARVNAEQEYQLVDMFANPGDFLTYIGGNVQGIMNGRDPILDPEYSGGAAQQKASAARKTNAEKDVRDAQNKVKDIQRQIEAIQSGLNPELVLKQAQERTAAESKINEIDTREIELINALSAAQASGTGVSEAKSALDDYYQQRNRARYEELASKAGDDQNNIDIARKAYEQAMKTGDNAAITEAAKNLARAVEVAKNNSDEMAKLANGMYKPADSGIMRSVTNGTFDAYGLNGIGVNSIEKQQLDALKEIAKNTENNNEPVVGE